LDIERIKRENPIPSKEQLYQVLDEFATYYERLGQFVIEQQEFICAITQTILLIATQATIQGTESFSSPEI
jgi:hypothetical protein